MGQKKAGSKLGRKAGHLLIQGEGLIMTAH